MSRTGVGVIATVLALAFAAPVMAQNRTPFGAEAAGNAAGTIPAWDGGLTKPVAGFQTGGHYSDPFKADKILFTITAANAEQYKNQLSPGQIALLKKYPTWKMNVYPTRRSAAFPKGVYDETAANAGVAKLAPGGNGVTGTKGGIPFPAPKDGLEAIWNTTLRYRGDTYAMKWGQAAVTREGSYTMVNFDYEYDFNYGNLSKPAKDREDNKLAYFLQTVTGPARLAGQILLVDETVDQVKEPRSAWTYNPGQRRVRLAPQRRLRQSRHRLGRPAHQRRLPDVQRRHRSLQLEARREAGDVHSVQLLQALRQRAEGRGRAAAGSHQPRSRALSTAPRLGRRGDVEGGDQPHLQEARLLHRRGQLVDRRHRQVRCRNELWRVAEQHSIIFYDVPMLYGTVEVHHDLQSARYLAMGLRNDQPKVYEKIKRDRADFTPAGLRGIGTR